MLLMVKFINSLSVIADVAKQFGVRSCLCYEVSDRNGVDQMKAAVAENVRFGKEAKQDPSRLAAMMAYMHPYTKPGNIRLCQSSQ